MRSWRIPLLIAGSLVAGLSACSDTEPPPVEDTEAPEVQVLFPPEIFDALHRVQDETLIYVGASDPSGVSQVAVYFQRPTDVEQTEIGTVTQPTTLEQVPDSLQGLFQVPQGWDLYEMYWNSQEVRSGIEPQLFAEAFDTKGNRRVSSAITVEVINTTDLDPPVADFVIDPPSGDTNTFFSFDPSITTDDVDEVSAIAVRWDFDGDGSWDVGDWDNAEQAPAFADEIQTFQFVRNNIYTIRMQARNTYFPSPSAVAIRILNVTPVGGDPEPPLTMLDETTGHNDFIEIPAGRYTRGPANPIGANRNEFPVHEVNLTSPYLILNREVTNTEYLNYINRSLDSVRVEFRDNQLFAADSTGYRLMDLSNSRIFFNIDAGGYQIDAGYEDHPVTGATWYGANDFAISYGLRLPTEAEWEVAARGDSLMYRYSHGRTLDAGDPTQMRRVNYEASGDPFEGNRGTTPVTFYDGRTESGFETIDTGFPWPEGRIYDMAGNAAEWVNDWYSPYRAGIQSNPQGPPTGDEYGFFKVVRGGSYERSANACRVTAREADRTPDDSFPSIGFRVAYFKSQNPSPGPFGIFGR